ncbi:hypothetical protein M1293_00850 [Candidatus Parvarchaeota archaeon]|nr:hypothetical protein [Candidatus Parvarchaeota archaeon]
MKRFLLGKRSQSALEYLTTYAWEFALIILVVVALFYTGVFNTSGFFSSAPVFSGFSGISIQNVVANSTVVELSMVNDENFGVNITNMALDYNGQNFTVFSCTEYSLYPGENTICAFVGSFPQRRISTHLYIDYSTNSINTLSAGSILFSPSNSAVKFPFIKTELNFTITNLQSTATSAPFQQEITFDPQFLQQYESSNLGNIRFYEGAQELYSWCQSGCSSSSDNVTFWVNLPNGVGADSSLNLTIVFLPLANYDGVYAGEAPQLSPIYAEYDNGADVFPELYNNFKGTTLNGFSGGTYKIDNGLTIYDNGNLVSTSAIPDGNTAVTIFGLFDSGGAVYSGSGSTYALGYDFYDGSGGTGLSYALNSNSGGNVNCENFDTNKSWGASAVPINTTGFYSLYSIYKSGNLTTEFYFNNIFDCAGSWLSGNPFYNSFSSTSDFQFYTQTTSNAYEYWQYIFARTLPPNGVMPTVSGPLVTRVPITFTNYQGTSTPSPFQQMVTVNSSHFSKYEANNLDNVFFFYSNGTIVPSWLESGDVATFNGETTSYNLGGTSSYIQGSSPYVFPLSGFAWVYDKNYGTSNFQVIFEFDGNTQGSSQFELALSTSGQLRFWNGSENFLSSLTVPLDSWSLVGFSVDSNNINLYVNGQIESFPTSNAPQDPGDGYWIIGWQNCCGDRDFNGSISNVQLYSSALSKTQADQLYLSGPSGSPLQNGELAGWWPLLGNANDMSGNNNNGVVNNVSFTFTSSASTKTTYWLKISSIPADSTKTVYIGFAPPYINSFNRLTGEAPQLSPIYAEYDNGAKLFNDYWNFNGTSMPSAFSVVNPNSKSTISVDNGLYIAPYPNNYAGIEYNSVFNPDSVVEYYEVSSYSVPNCWAVGEAVGSFNSSGGYLYVYAYPPGSVYGQLGWSAGNIVLSDGVIYNQIFRNITRSNVIIGEAWPSENLQVYYADGQDRQVSSTNELLIKSGISFSFGGYYCTNGSSIYTRWIRVRAYPPNGIMPAASFGGVI